MKILALLLIFALTPATAQDKKPDPWAQVRLLIGTWRGSVSGESGSGTVSRTYEFILNDNFIQEQNTSTYPPQEKNKQGEVHRHLSIISYDRERKALMLRQFHQESFINLYVLNSSASTEKKLVFESQDFENFDDSWKAKETYEIISSDEFVETFELAPPGKPFEVYSRNHFKRRP